MDLVVSGGRFIRDAESVCLEHDMPNNEVAGAESVASRFKVKYEKSSVDLGGSDQRVGNVSDSR